MSHGDYVVVFKGELIEGRTRSDTVERLEQVLKKDSTFVNMLFEGGAKTLKTDLDERSAQKYISAFAKLGIKTYAVDLAEIKRRRGQSTESPIAPQPAAAPIPTTEAPTAQAEIVEDLVAEDNSPSSAQDRSEDVEVVEEEVIEEEVVEDDSPDSAQAQSEDVEVIEEEVVEEEVIEEEVVEDDAGSVEVIEEDAETPEVVDGVVMEKSKAIESDKPADGQLDIPALDLSSEELPENENQIVDDENYENLIKDIPAPKWVVPLGVDDTGADALTMSHVGDEIENLKREYSQPTPDTSGLSLAGDEPEQTDT